jgi:GNAT superfamily N-acetyltransferase
MAVPDELPASSPVPEGLTIRRATDDDDEKVLSLLASTLGWRDDERHRDLFLWKHRRNPFGASPAWVAEDRDGIVGFRALMRWEFLVDGVTVRAVRAVDTATHPRAQGRGVFRTLTMRGVEEMTADGVSWIFNTPNAKSAPGYLRMGWRKVGKLPAAIRPRRLTALPGLLSARSAADLWSLPTSAGEDAASVLVETERIEELLALCRSYGGGIRTRLDAAYLLWRFGRNPVGYRVLFGGSTLRDGVVIFRVRRRGNLREALIAEVLDPRLPSAHRRSHLVAGVGKACGADYAVLLGRSRPRGWLPVPGGGPLLTWRPLKCSQEMPELDEWVLSTGDIELF